MVSGILVGDLFEEVECFDDASRPCQLLGEVPICRRRLAGHGQNERRGEGNEHANPVDGGAFRYLPDVLQESGQRGCRYVSTARCARSG
jgi:hypothetical protein